MKNIVVEFDPRIVVAWGKRVFLKGSVRIDGVFNSSYQELDSRE